MLPIVALSAHQLTRWPWLLPVGAVAGMGAITSLLLVHRLEPSAGNAADATAGAGQPRPDPRSRPAAPASAPAFNAAPAGVPRQVPTGSAASGRPPLAPPRLMRPAVAHASWRAALPGPSRLAGGSQPGSQPVTAGAPGAADGPG